MNTTIQTTKTGRIWEWTVTHDSQHAAGGYCRTQKDASSDAMSVAAPTMASKAMPAVHWLRFDWNDHAGEAGGWVADSQCGLHEAIAEPTRHGWRFWIVRLADGETLFSADVLLA